jgi:hypothetical protein
MTMTQDNLNTDNTVSDDTNIKMDGLKFNTNTHNDNNTISKANAEEMGDLQQQEDIPDVRHKNSVPIVPELLRTRFVTYGRLTRGWEDAQEEWLTRTATKWKKSVHKWSGTVIQATLDMGHVGAPTTEMLPPINTCSHGRPFDKAL